MQASAPVQVHLPQQDEGTSWCETNAAHLILSKQAERIGWDGLLGQIQQLLVWNQTDRTQQTHLSAALHNRRISAV